MLTTAVCPLYLLLLLLFHTTASWFRCPGAHVDHCCVFFMLLLLLLHTVSLQACPARQVRVLAISLCPHACCCCCCCCCCCGVYAPLQAGPAVQVRMLTEMLESYEREIQSLEGSINEAEEDLENTRWVEKI
jgi:hypothetical protein